MAQAVKVAKDIVGNFANLRPDNPGRFIEAVAQVVAQYPMQVGLDCADPLRGIASQVEFLSLKTLGAWCTERLEFYRALAAYVPPRASIAQQPRPELTEADHRKGLAAWRGMQLTLATDGPEAARALTFDQAATVGEEHMDRPVLALRKMEPSGLDDDALREIYKREAAE